MAPDSLPEFNMIRIAAMVLRVTLAVGLLSAVADRFGLWGPPGTPMVAWGNMPHFLAYVTTLNPWCPRSLIPVLGWTATISELLLGMALLAGYRLPVTAILTALLTASFAIAMALTTGVHEPLNYSVFVFSASCYLLAATSKSALQSEVKSTIT